MNENFFYSNRKLIFGGILVLGIASFVIYHFVVINAMEGKMREASYSLYNFNTVLNQKDSLQSLLEQKERYEDSIGKYLGHVAELQQNMEREIEKKHSVNYERVDNAPDDSVIVLFRSAVAANRQYSIERGH